MITESHRNPALLCPLWEVVGADGIIKVHVPFSLPGLSQMEKWLGSFSANPSVYIKEFCYLSQVYDLTWHDFYVIQASTLTPEEQSRVRAEPRQYTNQTHLVDSTVSVRDLAVLILGLSTRPEWLAEVGHHGLLPPLGYGDGLVKSY